MTREAREAALVVLALALAAGTPAPAQDLQQKLAAAKQNAAQNQQALRSYGWIEKVELSLKGEVKNTTVNSCRYGVDGKVQKTAVVEPPPPETTKEGADDAIMAFGSIVNAAQESRTTRAGRSQRRSTPRDRAAPSCC